MLHKVLCATHSPCFCQYNDTCSGSESNRCADLTADLRAVAHSNSHDVVVLVSQRWEPMTLDVLRGLQSMALRPDRTEPVKQSNCKSRTKRTNITDKVRSYSPSVCCKPYHNTHWPSHRGYLLRTEEPTQVFPKNTSLPLPIHICLFSVLLFLSQPVSHNSFPTIQQGIVQGVKLHFQQKSSSIRLRCICPDVCNWYAAPVKAPSHVLICQFIVETNHQTNKPKLLHFHDSYTNHPISSLHSLIFCIVNQYLRG